LHCIIKLLAQNIEVYIYAYIVLFRKKKIEIQIGFNIYIISSGCMDQTI
jgi:hypothetical protein